MFFEVLVFLALGIAVGVIFGLLPGVHPNLIILFIPLFSSLGLGTHALLAFVSAIAVSNSITSFIPSILLGVPDSGNELSILPGHRMLLKGHGYQAVKLAVVGSIGAIIFCIIFFPALSILVPLLFGAISDFVYILLVAIAALMILSESRKFAALALFSASGLVGLMSARLPIDGTLVLFPIFSGFFGVSMLLLQLRNRAEVPAQTQKELYVSKRTTNRSIISGSLGGVLSGLLPGVGASEIAALASVGRNEHAFLIRLGAITTANIIMSIIGLWLIGKSRSGLAVVIEQLVGIGFSDVMMILAAAMASGGISAILAIVAAKRGISLLRNLGQSALSAAVLAFMLALTIAFSGFYGLALLAVCTAIGMATNLSGVKRGMLMGVLIIPTIIFYIS